MICMTCAARSVRKQADPIADARQAQDTRAVWLRRTAAAAMGAHAARLGRGRLARQWRLTRPCVSAPGTTTRCVQYGCLSTAAVDVTTTFDHMACK
jgi:hypothetical protein